MKVHIVDGTYELFRQFFARPSRLSDEGVEIAALRAVLRGALSLLEEGATHIGYVTDHGIESFRNDLYDGYKSGEDVDPEIKVQFEPLEQGLEALGVALYPMKEYEADDGMASLATVASADARVVKVFLCTPDKDLAQCVEEGRVLQLDRRNKKLLNVSDVIEKYGVIPESIPDWLALTGDSADGFPGLKGWGAKSSATVLSHYKCIEEIPLAAGQWEITVRGSARLAKTLAENYDEALLYKKLATLVKESPTAKNVDELRWVKPLDSLHSFAKNIGAEDLVRRAEKLAAARASESTGLD